MSLYFKNEFKRALFSKKSLIIFIIVFVLFIISFINFTNIKIFIFNLSEFKKLYDSIDVFILLKDDALVLLAPILASFIFSDSYLLDIDSKFINFIYTRVSRKKYFFTKLLVNALASSLVITFASILVFICLYCILGLNQTSLHQPINSFTYIYAQSRFLYLILLFITSFIFYTIFSTLSLGISPWIKNKYLTVLSSFFIYILSGTLLQYMGLSKLDGTILFTLNRIATQLDIVIYQIVLLVIGYLLFYFGVLKKNEEIY